MNFESVIFALFPTICYHFCQKENKEEEEKVHIKRLCKLFQLHSFFCWKAFVVKPKTNIFFIFFFPRTTRRRRRRSEQQQLQEQQQEQEQEQHPPRNHHKKAKNTRKRFFFISLKEKGRN